MPPGADRIRPARPLSEAMDRALPEPRTGRLASAMHDAAGAAPHRGGR